MLAVDRCLDLSYLLLALCFTHWRTQTHITMVTSIICKSHQQRISPAFFSPSALERSKSNLIIPYCFSCPTIKEVAGGGRDLTQLLGYFFLCAAMAGPRRVVMDAACQNAYWWWSAKTQFAVIRQLPSNYVCAKAFLKPSNSNPSLFSEWLDHCPWQTGTKWAALCMLPLMFYWFA